MDGQPPARSELDASKPNTIDRTGRTRSSSTSERAQSTKPMRNDQAPDAEDQDDGQERDDEDAVMPPATAAAAAAAAAAAQVVVEEDLGQVVAPSTPADSWRVAYIYAYLVKFTDLYPSATPTKKSLLLDIKSFEDALLASSPPSTSSLRRDPRTGLLQSDYRPASTIHRATWLPSEITQAEYEYDQLVAQAQLDNLPPPPYPTTGPLSTESYEIAAPPKSALLIEIMQSFYDIMGYFPEFYNPKDRKGWFAWCVRFVNTRLGSGPLKGGIGWEVNLMRSVRRKWERTYTSWRVSAVIDDVWGVGGAYRRVGVKIGREDEGNFWRLKWEEKVHVIQHIIDYLLTYGKAVRREIKVAYDNERDPKDVHYESSSSSEDETDDAFITDIADADPTQEEPEALNALAFEPLGTTSTRTIASFEEGGDDGVEVKESLMMIYALDSSARLFGLAFPSSRGSARSDGEGREEEEEKGLSRPSSADPAFEWRTLTRSVEEYNEFIARVEEVEAKDAQSAEEGKAKSWLVDAPIQPCVKMRIAKIKAGAALGTNRKKRKRRTTTIATANTPNKRPMRSSVLGRKTSSYFEVDEIEDDEASVEGQRRSLRTRARRMVQQQQEQLEEDESTDEDDEDDDEFEPEPVPIPTKPLSQALKDRLPSVQELQTVLDGLHAQREEEEKFVQERLGGGNNGSAVASSSKITLDSIHGRSGAASSTTTTLPFLPPRLPTPPPPPVISARSARLRVQEEKAHHDYYTQLNEEKQRQKIQHELAQREHKKRQEAKTKAQALKIARAEEKKREEEERERSKRQGERKELEKRIKERRAEGEGGRRVSQRLSLMLEVDEERLRVLVEEETKREEERRRRKEEKIEKEVRQGTEEAGEAKGVNEVSKVKDGEVVGPPSAEVAMGDGTVSANGSTAPSPTQPSTTNGVEAGPVDVSVPANEESTPPIVEAAPSPFLDTPVAPPIEASAVPSRPEMNGHDSLPKGSTPQP
ncbi:BZ3500_MvSof-1268-A1-R1_Chr7-1g09083 [Microbotryum saponariae]|uniref:BZ3500_MvSof-1268-A1-R1_Chr7-1g09083 protein n=1 Tax=Microbotryum saponariae TaxID=289078 RepID=A0A2X0NC12_9BASI|nr:BZ3501_MvSof-1269-A2-R1_Chr7-1g08787 [Microbotryum saponariae]SDA02766.1 BZ3500_MvSof-1268-A1-R1_Chr7-1g09083 [Microbotryum saponariae]